MRKPETISDEMWNKMSPKMRQRAIDFAALSPEELNARRTAHREKMMARRGAMRQRGKPENPGQENDNANANAGG